MSNRNNRQNITGDGNSRGYKPTKKARVLAALKGIGGLNRFEAERHGDHCLNSTISSLEADGHQFKRWWESVPSRFTEAQVLVKRYFWISGPDEAIR